MTKNKIVVLLIVLSILSALNLFWKFSMDAAFSQMNSGRQLNVILSIILIIICVISIIALFVLSKKERK